MRHVREKVPWSAQARSASPSQSHPGPFAHGERRADQRRDEGDCFASERPADRLRVGRRVVTPERAKICPSFVSRCKLFFLLVLSV